MRQRKHCKYGSICVSPIYVDIFVDVEPGQVLDLGRFMEIYEILNLQLDTRVDYTTRAGLIEFYRPAIEQEAVRVF